MRPSFGAASDSWLSSREERVIATSHLSTVSIDFNHVTEERQGCHPCVLQVIISPVDNTDTCKMPAGTHRGEGGPSHSLENGL